MKVLYNEDLANRISLESCGYVGNHMAEALTGENAGGLWSSEITIFRVPTSCTVREGHTHSNAIASCWATRRSQRTLHAWKPHARKSGGPRNILCAKSGMGESRLQKSPGV
jgi:hypothetical protein